MKEEQSGSGLWGHEAGAAPLNPKLFSTWVGTSTEQNKSVKTASVKTFEIYESFHRSVIHRFESHREKESQNWKNHRFLA